MEQIAINILPKGAKPVCHSSQFDEGRQIMFNLFNDDTPYTLSGTETISVLVRKPDGAEVVDSVTNTSDSYVIWDVSADACELSGVCECELSITKNGIVLGSKNFTMKVEEDAYNGKTIEVRTASGRIATFSTNMVEAFKSLKTDITPVQDLHGYSKPWSGGGGKNKANANNQTGISNEHIRQYVLNLPVGTYAVSAYCSSTSDTDCAVLFIYSDDTNSPIQYLRNGNWSQTTINATKEVKQLNIYSSTGYSTSQNYTLTAINSLQVEQGSTATAYEPYSNICPISGFSTLNVTRTGVNLAKYWRNAYINANGTIITNNNNALCELGYLKSGVKIAFNHYQNTYGCGIAVYSDSSYTNKIDVNGNIQSNVSTLTLEHSGYYLFWFNVATNTASETFINDNSLGVYVGETVGTFEPYNGQTATVNFGQTVYGGVADVTGGKVNVTYALTPLNNKTWRKSGNIFYTTGFDNAPEEMSFTGDFMCAIGTPVNKDWQYLAVGECCLRNSLHALNKWSLAYCSDAYSTVEEFVSALNADCTITYPLATPIEITTTPENLTALSGQTNNVYGDTNGDTTVEYYIEV